MSLPSKIYSRFVALTFVSVLAVGLLANCSGTASTLIGSSEGGANGAAACPSVAPDNESACTAGQGTCKYSGSVVCECGMQTQRWTCTACPVCPTAQPAMGATCMAGGGGGVCGAALTCAYGATDCTCGAGAGGAETWRCGACPTTQPAAGAARCATDGLACDYATTTCTCERGQGAGAPDGVGCV